MYLYAVETRGQTRVDGGREKGGMGDEEHRNVDRSKHPRNTLQACVSVTLFAISPSLLLCSLPPQFQPTTITPPFLPSPGSWPGDGAEFKAVLCLAADGALRLDYTPLLPNKMSRYVLLLSFQLSDKARDSLCATDLHLLNEDGRGFQGKKENENQFLFWRP